MAAIFNGTTSDLSASFSAVAPAYPILMAAWIKPAVANANLNVIGLSDDGTGGSLDALALAARGDQSGDPIWATATAADSSSNAAATAGFVVPVDGQGNPVPRWYFVAALFLSASSRKTLISTWGQSSIAWGTPETTTRAVGSITHMSIGSLLNGGVANSFNGRIAHATIWTTIDPNFADLIVTQLARGLTAPQIWHQAPADMYQPLASAVNETGYLGATMTATNVTFAAADSPSPDITINPQAARADDFRLPISSYSPRFPWPDYGTTPGPLPQDRIVVVDADGYLQLAGATDENWIGVSLPSNPNQRYQRIVTRGDCQPIAIEKASGADFALGDTAYLAADGKVDDEGTVRAGTVIFTNANLARIVVH